MSTDAIKIGIDFGTVTTEVSYIWSHHGPESLKDIEHWPGSYIPTPVVPSLIGYNTDNGSLGWGYLAVDQPVVYAWSKLLLNDEMDPGLTDQVLRDISNSTILRPPGMREPVDIVSGFLGQLRIHILDNLKKLEHLGSQPMEFIFTVPVSWPNQARSSMENAIKQAGFGSRACDKFYIINEAEAAATAIYRESSAFQVGEGVLICDIGGGTIDVSACHITDVSSAVLVETLATEIGLNCGSAAFDARFYQLLSNHLGIPLCDLPAIYSPLGRAMLQMLDRLKLTFTGYEEPEPIRIALNPTREEPGLYDLQRRAVILQPHHVRSLFNPLIDQIEGCIRFQIHAANQKFGRPIIKKVVLTGGLGASPYILHRLNDLLSRDQDLGIEPLIRLKNPHLMVAHGAALRGVVGKLTPTRKSWLHYGVAVHQSICCPQWRRNGVNLQFSQYNPCHWIFQKAHSYATDHNHRSLIVQVVQFHDQSKIKTIKIWSCDTDEQPLYVDTARMRHKHSLLCDLRNIKEEECAAGEYQGQYVLIFDVTVDVKFTHETGEVELVASAFGEKVGQTSFFLDRE